MKATKSRACELLLLLFASGALAEIYHGEAIALFLPLCAWPIKDVYILLLTFDAALTASLSARLLLPPLTVFFGCAAAREADEIISGLQNAWRRAVLLCFVTLLHFVLCAWGLNAAAVMRRLLRGRGVQSRIRFASLLCTLAAFIACALLIWLGRQSVL